MARGELVWWRHVGTRHRASVFPTARLRITGERSVRRREVIRLNPGCTIEVCDVTNGGTVEFAFLHDSEIEAFRASIPPAE